MITTHSQSCISNGQYINIMLSFILTLLVHTSQSCHPSLAPSELIIVHNQTCSWLQTPEQCLTSAGAGDNQQEFATWEALNSRKQNGNCFCFNGNCQYYSSLDQISLKWKVRLHSALEGG